MIDVIIPAYNCRKTLDRTLSSLVAQTNSDFKVLVVDDCSTEDIKTIVKSYENKLNIGYIRNDINLGCGMSRQTGIDNTYCKYFTFLDSDDVFMPYTVEVFNAIIKNNPGIEYVHSYIYEQTNTNNKSAMIVHKDGYVFCHGKLYNRKKINEYGIKNSPLVKYHDDSYFNSMCSELLRMTVSKIPTVIWCNNSESITRKQDEERDRLIKKDFIQAMRMSSDFVYQYKEHVEHLDTTLNILRNGCKYTEFTEDELFELKELMEAI